MNEKQKAELVRQLAEGNHVFWKCNPCGDVFAMEVEGALKNPDIPYTCGNCESKDCSFDVESAKVYYASLIDHAVLWGSEASEIHRERAKRGHPVVHSGNAHECWYCVNGNEP